MVCERDNGGGTTSGSTIGADTGDDAIYILYNILKYQKSFIIKDFF